jgi:hypothetical protein
MHGSGCQAQVWWDKGGADGYYNSGNSGETDIMGMWVQAMPLNGLNPSLPAISPTTFCSLVRDNVTTAISGAWVRVWPLGGQISCSLWSISSTGFAGGYDGTASVSSTGSDYQSLSISVGNLTQFSGGSYMIECSVSPSAYAEILSIKWQEQ